MLLVLISEIVTLADTRLQMFISQNCLTPNLEIWILLVLPSAIRSSSQEGFFRSCLTVWRDISRVKCIGAEQNKNGSVLTGATHIHSHGQTQLSFQWTK